MRYLIVGRIRPERAGAWLTPQVWRAGDDHAYTVSADAGQIAVVADVPEGVEYLDAFVMAEQVTEAVVSALGFATGTGYGVELVQVVSAAGEVKTFGVRPGQLEFSPHEPVFLQASEVARRDAFFRLALRDYCRAMRETLDCAHYCYRAVEAIKSAFAASTAGNGWPEMHATLGTTRGGIDATLKAFADPVRHGNWLAFPPTTAAQRHGMLLLTRDVLRRYFEWKQGAAQQPGALDEQAHLSEPTLAGDPGDTQVCEAEMGVQGEDWHWRSGEGTSVQIGYVNPNGQKCCGHRGVAGTDHGQLAYKVECTVCGHVYGANGSDMHERRCPMHAGGKPGIAFWQV